MSGTSNESSGSNIKLGDSLALNIPPDLVRDFKAAAGRGDVRRKMLEVLEDWADAREAQKRIADIQSGKEKTVPWAQVKRGLGL